MSAKHALLGLMRDRPGYPYDLGARLHSRLGPSWDLNPGQLSQTIKRMHRDGQVEAVAGERAGETRQIYAITDRGLEELGRWFESVGEQERPLRSELMVKLALAGPKRLELISEQVESEMQKRAEALAHIVRARDSIDLSRQPLRADQVMLHLSLGLDIARLQAGLRWAQEAREVVSSLIDSEALWPTERERAEACGAADQRRRDARSELFAKMSRPGMQRIDGDSP